MASAAAGLGKVPAPLTLLPLPIVGTMCDSLLLFVAVPGALGWVAVVAIIIIIIIIIIIAVVAVATVGCVVAVVVVAVVVVVVVVGITRRHGCCETREGAASVSSCTTKGCNCPQTLSASRFGRRNAVKALVLQKMLDYLSKKLLETVFFI